MKLKEVDPNNYDSFIFRDPRTSFHGMPSTNDGVLYVVESREGDSVELARFDPVSGKFIERVGTSIHRHRNDETYEGPLARVIQEELGLAQTSPKCTKTQPQLVAATDNEEPHTPHGWTEEQRATQSVLGLTRESDETPP